MATVIETIDKIAIRVAKIDEFLGDLPALYATEYGTASVALDEKFDAALAAFATLREKFAAAKAQFEADNNIPTGQGGGEC